MRLGRRRRLATHPDALGYVASAVAVFAICLGIGYVKSVVIGGGAFEPNWAEDAAIAVAAGIATYFGPDAAQRRRNRKELKNSMAEKR